MADQEGTDWIRLPLNLGIWLDINRIGISQLTSGVSREALPTNKMLVGVPGPHTDSQWVSSEEVVCSAKQLMYT